MAVTDEELDSDSSSVGCVWRQLTRLDLQDASILIQKKDVAQLNNVDIYLSAS